MTNALVHAGTTIAVRVQVTRNRLRVEVGDGGALSPALRDYQPTSNTGRGLHLVADLVDRWGSTSEPGGKIVWFEIGGHRRREPRETASPKPDDFVDIELLQFPVLLHAAWQEHASALLRDLLLSSIDEEGASFARHAQASEALSWLYQQVPVPGLGVDPAQIMGDAIEPRVTADRVMLTIPRAAVAGFATLDAMLDEAVEQAVLGTLLVPPTQPEIVEMRRWLCGEIGKQAGPGTAPESARPPEPWSAQVAGTQTTVLLRREVTGWDPGEVSGSPRELLAIDEAGVILAVSEPTLLRLGYAHEKDLLGHRIVVVIPFRYQQAHIAGISLHLTNGRSPLLGARIVVPVLRADGSEHLTGLLVESRAVEGGDRIFVAEFFDAA